MKLNLGPGPYYEKGWVNVEVCKEFKADVYLEDPMVLPFDNESASLVYAGHVLEHIEWERVPTYLDEIYRVLSPQGTLLIVGPDMWRGLELWKKGKLETGLSELLEWESLPGWEAPRHFWNCSEKRVTLLMDKEKWVITPVDITSNKLDSWPVVSRIGWQMALLAVKR